MTINIYRAWVTGSYVGNVASQAQLCRAYDNSTTATMQPG